MFQYFYTSLLCCFFIEFVLISLISLSVTSAEWLAAILKISVLLYSPVGEYVLQLNTSNLTNQRVGFVMFTCAKILKGDMTNG